MKDEIPSNEFGEIIDSKFMDKAVKKIRKLPKEKIDEMFYKLGWVDLERGQNKALPDWRLEKIKKEKNSINSFLINLFQETPKKDFIKAIEEAGT